MTRRNLILGGLASAFGLFLGRTAKATSPKAVEVQVPMPSLGQQSFRPYRGRCDVVFPEIASVRFKPGDNVYLDFGGLQ